MPPEVIVCPREELVRVAVERFERLARDALAARGRFACAVPGGSVAESLFPNFARLGLPWKQVHVFFGDERAVPSTDPDSNYGLARRLWLDAVPANAHPMLADRDDLDAANAYSEELRAALGDPPQLDLALLGMGPDGHVCSLFPGHALLHEQHRWVAAVYDSPKPPPRRLTLTLPALAAARTIWIVALDASKASAVRDAIENERSPLPVALAARSGPPATFFLDREAASALGGS
jgi:6-phosphogluconolactonase